MIPIPFLMLLGVAQAPRAAVHYVSSDGTATWEQAIDITAPCALTTANSNVDADDTVCLFKGTYTGSCIKPGRSGTRDNPIVYRNYENDSVQFTDTDFGILIDGKSHVIVSGLHFHYMGHFLYIRNNAHYNTIGNCTFDQARDSTTWGGSKIFYTSQYNRIHHCSFSRWGYANDSSHAGALFDVGREAETTDSSYYNLIEDNVFFYGGHHCLAAWSKYCIFRNNYLHHERSPTDGFGYRCAITHGKAVDRNLYEGNIFAFAYKASGMSLRSSNNIFRRNIFYHNGLGGIQCVSMEDYTPASFNRIFHNIFYYNGHDAEYSGFSGGIYFCDWGEGDPEGNVVKNNIFYRNKGGMITTDAVDTEQKVENNWESGDPLFVNDELVEDPFATPLPDLRLQENSPCIDSGAGLTTITSTDGSGTSFTVEDAGYFTDGWGMIPGDMLQLEHSVERMRIIEVDYVNNNLIVDRTVTWKQGDGISLAYTGKAPDLGAYEYGDTTAIRYERRSPKRVSAEIFISYQRSTGRVVFTFPERTFPAGHGNRLMVYDLSGRLVKELYTGKNGAVWNCSGSENSVYGLRWKTAGGSVGRRKFLLR